MASCTLRRLRLLFETGTPRNRTQRTRRLRGASTRSASMARILGAVSACLFLQCAVASAYPDLDWKLYDGMDAAGPGKLCFYEERSIARARGIIVRIWTKCLSRSALDAAGAVHRNALYSRAVVDMSVSRRIYGYELPILSLETLGKKDIVAAI